MSLFDVFFSFLGDLPRGVKEWIGQPMPTRDQVISTEPLTPPPMQAHRPPLEFSNSAVAPRVENPNFISLNSENPEGENSNGPIPNQIQVSQSKSSELNPKKGSECYGTQILLPKMDI